PHTLEEAYEVADCIESGNLDELKGELGDLLFQIIFYAQLAQEQNLFDFNDLVEQLNDKLTRRHPHVFGEKKELTDDQLS
ncbi:MazG nucleotide pyrophosphohydrolase domain-containing protein, partial [Pseudoalteromonas sp. Q18-MNA-CIBAN-0097]